MVVWLIGCGASLSNEVFLEDADFLAALPGREQLAATYPGSPGCGAIGDDVASLYTLTVCSLEGTDNLLAQTTATTDVVRAVAPTERDTDYRRWGPGAWDLAPGAWLLGEMSRSGTGAYYAWTFSVAESVDGPWEPLLDGYHYGGAEAISTGVGAFDWDVAQQYRFDDQPGEGVVTVTYDSSGDGEVLVEAQDVAFGFGAQPASADWWFGADPDGGGDFEYRSSDTLGDDVDASIRARFDETGAGRADAVVNETFFEGAIVDFVQCWDATGALTWQWEATSGSEEGSVDACIFDDKARAENLP